MPLKKILLIAELVVLPVLFALSLPLFFRLNIFQDPGQLSSILAMIIFPFGEGLLTIFLSSSEKISKTAYKFFMPWVPIILFFTIAFVLNLEECACWMIGLPIFLFLSSVGGLTAGYFKKRHQL